MSAPITLIDRLKTVACVHGYERAFRESLDQILALEAEITRIDERRIRAEKAEVKLTGDLLEMEKERGRLAKLIRDYQCVSGVEWLG